jgi:hypothetical protein
MNLVAAVVPSVLWLMIANIVFAILLVILAFYTLHKKGDVKIVLARKPLRIKIECKEKRVPR